jgi:hypothetical protein
VALGGIVIVSTGIVAAVEPNRVVPGLLAGDAFYHLRPTRYWRQRLREDSKAEDLSDEVRRAFVGHTGASPVLKECLQDPDADLRATAAWLLGRTGPYRECVPPLLTALHDVEITVRIQAIRSLGHIGSDASEAGPSLAQCLDDPDHQVAHEANVAMWLVAPRFAAERGGWQLFKSKEWRFAAFFPRAPKDSTGNLDTPFGAFKIHNWMESYGVDNFAVAVIDYSKEVADAITPDEWIRRLKAAPGPLG